MMVKGAKCVSVPNERRKLVDKMCWAKASPPYTPGRGREQVGSKSHVLGHLCEKAVSRSCVMSWASTQSSVSVRASVTVLQNVCVCVCVCSKGQAHEAQGKPWNGGSGPG
jgi:hypothetical protein